MFYERYSDILLPGGRLVSVIDDGLLSGSDSAWFREFLREKFIVKAVVSLPGDAFQRSKARVKTSLIVLTKKKNEMESQPDVFMYPCRFVGIDDPARQRVLPVDEKLRKSAKEEIFDVLKEYNKFTEGKGSAKYIVRSDKVQERLDVKHCLMKLGSTANTWKKGGLSTLRLSDLVNPKEFSDEDKIISSEYEGTVQYLRVRYDGGADIGEEVDPAETTYPYMFRVHEGDIVISNIAATYGSVAVVDELTDGCVVTNEYTVLSVKDGHDPLTVWTLMRSKEARADMLLAATGANRTRVKWENISQIEIPYPELKEAKIFAEKLREFNKLDKALRDQRQKAIEAFSRGLILNGNDAERVLQAFKPPK